MLLNSFMRWGMALVFFSGISFAAPSDDACSRLPQAVRCGSGCWTDFQGTLACFNPRVLVEGRFLLLGASGEGFCALLGRKLSDVHYYEEDPSILPSIVAELNPDGTFAGTIRSSTWLDGVWCD